VADFADDVFVQGSRAKGFASPSRDLDLAIRVSRDDFDTLITQRMATLKKGSDTYDTLVVASQRRRIHAGEIGLSGLRKAIERAIGIKTQLTVVEIGGLFDRPPFIPVRTSTS
jgi:hypothetical protein